VGALIFFFLLLYSRYHAAFPFLAVERARSACLQCRLSCSSCFGSLFEDAIFGR
jgi:hypothetical protein